MFSTTPRESKPLQSPVVYRLTPGEFRDKFSSDLAFTVLDIEPKPLPGGDYGISGNHAETFADIWEKKYGKRPDMVVPSGPVAASQTPGRQPATEASAPPGKTRYVLDRFSASYLRGFDMTGLNLTSEHLSDGRVIVSGTDAERFVDLWEARMGERLPEYLGDSIPVSGSVAAEAPLISGAQSSGAVLPPGSTRKRIESPGEGGEGHFEEVPDNLPGIKLLSFDSGKHQLELTGGAKAYLGKLGLIGPDEGTTLLNKGKDETNRILDALRRGRYALDKPGSDLVSKVRGAVPLDGDGSTAVLWVTGEQRQVLDRVLRAKGELDSAKGDPILKGPAEAAYQQWLTALINPTAPSTVPGSTPAAGSGDGSEESSSHTKPKRSLFGPPDSEFKKKAITALGAAARIGLWFYSVPKFKKEEWKQKDEERRASRAASEPSPYSPREDAWAPEPAVQTESPIDWSAQLPNSPSEPPSEEGKPPAPGIDWNAQFGDEGGKT